MSQTLAITVSPSGLDGEYLTVGDALRQVLDLVETLERAEQVDSGNKQIVWRLTEAHTNSPPLTVTMTAFPINPSILVSMKAHAVLGRLETGIKDLLAGTCPDWVDRDVAVPLKRFFGRNLNGIGNTQVSFEGDDRISVLPSG